MNAVVAAPLLLATLLAGAAARTHAATTPVTAPAVATAVEAPKTRKDAASEWSADGLQKVKIPGIDVAYTQPGTSLAPYKRVLLRPISVTFRRNWGRSNLDRGTRVRPEDQQRIKEKLAALVREEMLKELSTGGYHVADGPADDVLELDLAISDLYITAPDVMTARTVVISVSAGEMTLIAELRDSASGQVLMRMYDQATGDDFNRARRLTNVENEHEARDAASAWARALRKQLDLAKVGAGG